jgi:hypothetical protein
MLALAIASAAASAQVDSTWRDHERALQAARAANDTVGYRSQLDAEYRAIGTTPRIATRFAALALNAHDSAGALRWMGALSAMDVDLDSEMVAAFGALAGARAVSALRASQAFATRAVGAPVIVARLPDADMISEDLAYDAKSGRFLLSSVHRGGIYAVANGRTTTLVEPRADSTWGMFALGVDSARGVLWATTAAFANAAGYSPADSGRSALIQYDVHTGARRGRYLAPDSGAHVLGDLTLASSGEVYVSDGVGGGVYVLAPGRSSLRVLVPRGTFSSPQTPALSSDGATLFVPDYSIGIAAVNVANGKVTWLTHSDSLALAGIDGMRRVGRDLVVVQNGLEPNRIMRLTLDASMRRVVRATAIARGATARSLTHATMVDDWLYFIANSGWERAADDGTMTAAASASDAPVIMRVRIAR